MDAVLPDSSSAKPTSFSTSQKNKAQTDSVLESLLAPVPPGAAARPVRRVIPPAVKQPIADVKPAVADVKTEPASTVHFCVFSTTICIYIAQYCCMFFWSDQFITSVF
jgi:hypothetical protein